MGVAENSRGPKATAVHCRRGLGLVLAIAWLTVACGPPDSFSLKVARTKRSPPDASVTIDEEFVGLLGYVTARGVRLPEGQHRITVERDGYFPWDRIVVSDRKPIHLEVDLIPLPD